MAAAELLLATPEPLPEQVVSGPSVEWCANWFSQVVEEHERGPEMHRAVSCAAFATRECRWPGTGGLRAPAELAPIVYQLVGVPDEGWPAGMAKLAEVAGAAGADPEPTLVGLAELRRLGRAAFGG